MRYLKHDIYTNIMNAYKSFDGESLLDIYASAISLIITDYKTDLVSLLIKSGFKADDTDDYEKLAKLTVQAAKTSETFRTGLSKLIIQATNEGGKLSADGAGWQKFKGIFSGENLKKVNEGLGTVVGIGGTVLEGKNIWDNIFNRPSGGGSTSGGGGSTSSGGGSTSSGVSEELLEKILGMKDGNKGGSSMSTGAIIAIVGVSIVVLSLGVFLIVKYSKK